MTFACKSRIVFMSITTTRCLQIHRRGDRTRRFTRSSSTAAFFVIASSARRRASRRPASSTRLSGARRDRRRMPVPRPAWTYPSRQEPLALWNAFSRSSLDSAESSGLKSAPRAGSCQISTPTCCVCCSTSGSTTTRLSPLLSKLSKGRTVADRTALRVGDPGRAMRCD